MNHQTLLCFDYGKKRIGIAVGQTITKTATALEIINTINEKPDWDRITLLINKWQPVRLIIGYPLTLENKYQEMTEIAERFSRQLKHRYKLPVELMSEQLSSYEARAYLKSSYGVDAVAAQLILESWLNEFIHKQVYLS